MEFEQPIIPFKDHEFRLNIWQKCGKRVLQQEMSQCSKYI